MKGIIGITLGDQAGIGPEIVQLAIDSGKLNPGFACRIIGKRVIATMDVQRPRLRNPHSMHSRIRPASRSPAKSTLW